MVLMFKGKKVNPIFPSIREEYADPSTCSYFLLLRVFIVIIYAEEYERPNFSDIITEIWDLKRRCGNVTNIIVDSANPEIVQALKREFKERYD